MIIFFSFNFDIFSLFYLARKVSMNTTCPIARSLFSCWVPGPEVSASIWLQPISSFSTTATGTLKSIFRLWYEIVAPIRYCCAYTIYRDSTNAPVHFLQMSSWSRNREDRKYRLWIGFNFLLASIDINIEKTCLDFFLHLITPCVRFTCCKTNNVLVIF